MSREIPENLTLSMFKEMDYNHSCVGNRRRVGGVAEWKCSGIACYKCILADGDAAPTVMEIIEATKKLLEKEQSVEHIN